MLTYSLSLLILIFLVASITVWVAGVHLANATDVLTTRWELGEAMGGLILLAIVTNLPEIAITVSGALHNNLGVAIGNILGGIAIQTLVLAYIDFFGVGSKAAFTYIAASLTLVLEGLLVMSILSIVIMGSQLKFTASLAGISPATLMIVIFWVGGLWLINRTRDALPWHNKGHALNAQTHARGHAEKQKALIAKQHKISSQYTVLVFGICALLTLVAGIFLEASGSAIAQHIGIDGVLFGATILAAATSLPEVSTGMSSVKLGDYQLAISDIFGGNAFLPVLFLLAELISGTPILQNAQKTDIYLTALGILLTAVYTAGLIFRAQRQVFNMGIDSIIVIIIFVLGIIGLLQI
jgi:cation:H+ antiporter